MSKNKLIHINQLSNHLHIDCSRTVNQVYCKISTKCWLI